MATYWELIDEVGSPKTPGPLAFANIVIGDPSPLSFLDFILLADFF